MVTELVENHFAIGDDVVIDAMVRLHLSVDDRRNSGNDVLFPFCPDRTRRRLTSCCSRQAASCAIFVAGAGG